MMRSTSASCWDQKLCGFGQDQSAPSVTAFLSRKVTTINRYRCCDPQKIMRMRNSQSLIMRTGFAPVKTEQYIWYCEKAMKGYKQPETQLPAPLADTL